MAGRPAVANNHPSPPPTMLVLLPDSVRGLDELGLLARSPAATKWLAPYLPYAPYAAAASRALAPMVAERVSTPPAAAVAHPPPPLPPVSPALLDTALCVDVVVHPEHVAASVAASPPPPPPLLCTSILLLPTVTCAAWVFGIAAATTPTNCAGPCGAGSHADGGTHFLPTSGRFAYDVLAGELLLAGARGDGAAVAIAPCRGMLGPTPVWQAISLSRGVAAAGVGGSSAVDATSAAQPPPFRPPRSPIVPARVLGRVGVQLYPSEAATSPPVVDAWATTAGAAGKGATAMAAALAGLVGRYGAASLSGPDEPVLSAAFVTVAPTAPEGVAALRRQLLTVVASQEGGVDPRRLSVTPPAGAEWAHTSGVTPVGSPPTPCLPPHQRQGGTPSGSPPTLTWAEVGGAPHRARSSSPLSLRRRRVEGLSLNSPPSSPDRHGAHGAAAAPRAAGWAGTLPPPAASVAAASATGSRPVRPAIAGTPPNQRLHSTHNVSTIQSSKTRERILKNRESAFRSNERKRARLRGESAPPIGRGWRRYQAGPSREGSRANEESGGTDDGKDEGAGASVSAEGAGVADPGGGGVGAVLKCRDDKEAVPLRDNGKDEEGGDERADE